MFIAISKFRWDPLNGVGKQLFKSQNQLLRDAKLITAHGLKGLDGFIEQDGKAAALRDFILSAKDQDQHLFSEVSQVNVGRVCFHTAKDHFEAARATVDRLVEEHIPAPAADVDVAGSFGRNTR